MEKKDETPFGVSVGSRSSSRTWDQEARLEVPLHVTSSHSPEIMAVWSELGQPPPQPWPQAPEEEEGEGSSGGSYAGQRDSLLWGALRVQEKPWI